MPSLINLKRLSFKLFYTSCLILSFSHSSIALAIPVGTHPAKHICKAVSSSGFFFPTAGFAVQGNSESVIFECVEQIREYNTGRNSIEEVISLYMNGTITDWEGQYVDSRFQSPVTGRIYLSLSAVCGDGFERGYDDGAGESYCRPKKDAANECTIGNPFSIYTGDKYEDAADIKGGGLFPVEFKRQYHSLKDPVPIRTGISTGSIGNRWDHSYSQVITGMLTSPMDYSWEISDGSTKSFNNEVINHYGSDPKAFVQTVTMHRPDGGVLVFTNNFNPGTQCFISSQWESRNSEVSGSLVITDPCDLVSDYVFTDRNEVKETYGANGLLIRKQDISGIQHDLTYTGGLLSEVRHSLGYSITFEYVGDRISTITDSEGDAWTYRYDPAGNLQYVDSPDLTTTEYHYENPVFSSALTGITDGRGIRYSHYQYDTLGRLESEYHGAYTVVPEERIDGISVQYGLSSGSLNQLTNSRGFTTDYRISSLNGYDMPASTLGFGCASCGLTGLIYEYFPDTYNLMRLIDNGKVTRFDNYGVRGNPELVTEAEGAPQQRSISYTYDPRYIDKATTIIEPSVFPGVNKVTTNTYDDFGNTTSITVTGYKPDGTPVSRSQSFTYNGPYHQLSEIDGPRTDVADITTIEYYPDNANLGNNRARMEKVTEPLGVVLYDSITYTATGKQAAYASGTSLLVEFTYYPGNDRLETQTLTDLSTGEARITRWTYIATGEVESITQGYAAPEATTLTFEFDDARRLTRIYDGFSNYIEYELDTEGNVVNENIYDQAGILLKALNQSFDAYNRLDISAQVNETRNQDFSPDGTLDLETDGKKVVTDYSYDALRRLTSITQDVGGAEPSSANALTQLGYDVQDNLVSVTDPNGGQTRYVYDDLGNLISMTSPDTGTSSYSYDESGNIATMTDAKGQVFNYSYDAQGRIILADAPGISDDIRYVYDSCENGAGKLCSVNRDVVTVSYGYTAFGDIKSSTQSVATFAPYEQAEAQVSYIYDAAGRIRDMIYPGGNKVTYTYDAAGNVYTVILNDGEKNLVTGALYYPFGPERFVTRDNGSSIFGYMDQAYRTFIAGHGGYFYDVIYYDENGNPATFYSSEGSKVHAYDALDRLDTSSGPYGSRDYGYDINGNRTSKQVDSVTNNYSYDTNTNRMNTNAGSSVVLDANGNTSSLGGMSISFTSDNRVSNIPGNAYYTYNGLGERSMKALLASGVAGTHGHKLKTIYVYGLDGKLLAETGSSGKVKKEYIYLNDKLLATVVYEPSGGESILNADMDNDGAIGVDDFLIWYFNHYSLGDISRDINVDGLLDTNDISLVVNCALSGGTAAGCATSSYDRSIYYAHNDHLGTPHMLSDETGTAVWSAVYDPFGKATVNDDLDADGSSVTLNIRFPGQYYDAESRLHYNYFRYYDPETGRYITSDPIGLNGGLNTFGYVGGNPLKWVDFLGLEWSWAGSGVYPTVSSVDWNNGKPYMDMIQSNDVVMPKPNGTFDLEGYMTKKAADEQKRKEKEREEKTTQCLLNSLEDAAISTVTNEALEEVLKKSGYKYIGGRLIPVYGLVTAPGILSDAIGCYLCN